MNDRNRESQNETEVQLKSSQNTIAIISEYLFSPKIHEAHFLIEGQNEIHLQLQTLFPFSQTVILPV